VCRDLAAIPGSTVLDGELVCLDADGCPRFYDLMYRRGECHYFDSISCGVIAMTCAPCRSRAAWPEGKLYGEALIELRPVASGAGVLIRPGKALPASVGIDICFTAPIGLVKVQTESDTSSIHVPCESISPTFETSRKREVAYE
jgi:hypothetical protein